MPNVIVPDPDDFADRLESAGIDPESFSLRNIEAWDRWHETHDEWDKYLELGLSDESVVAMWATGMDPEDAWAHLTIGADGDTWWVDIETASGKTYRIDIGDGYDIAWDFYDYADYEDVNIDKDIDTGEATA